MPRSRKPPPSVDGDPSGLDPAIRNLLAHAGLTLVRWRWSLAKAGYPFREPVETQSLLTQIDAVLFPEKKGTPTKSATTMPSVLPPKSS